MKVIKNMVTALSLKGEFARRRNKLYRIAYSWCHDPDLADDLVQDTMYKSLRSVDSLRDRTTIDTWMYRILYNCWQDYLRTSGRNVEFVETQDEKQLDQADSYQQKQIVDRVRESIEQLPLPLVPILLFPDVPSH